LEGKIQFMFRIARDLLRWISRHDSTKTSRRAFHPLDLRVRLRWVGFGAVDELSMPRVSSALAAAKPSSGRLLTTLELPNVRLRLRWIGLSTLKRPFVVALGLLILLVMYSAWARPNNANNETFNPEQGLLADLASDDIKLGNETFRLIHSPLDIGQAKDAFDNNLDTLMRGRNANPFIMDFEFPQSEAIKGFMMDMGRMDFYLRVKVYAPGGSEPVVYQGEYRDQPPIPHVDMDFVNGPGQVRRIYIEVEQINPPDEVHVHIRELVFKK
jgi:hypothetical protein